MGIRRFNNFLKGTSPKVNIIARMEFEPAFFEAAVQHFSHYAMETPFWN